MKNDPQIVYCYSINDNCFIFMVILMVSDSKFFRIYQQIYFIMSFSYFLFFNFFVVLFTLAHSNVSNS